MKQFMKLASHSVNVLVSGKGKFMENAIILRTGAESDLSNDFVARFS